MTKNDTGHFSIWDIPVALVLLTRLPMPQLPETVFARQASATWAFPLVGLAVGALSVAVGWIGLIINLPTLVCAILMVITLIISTGAMHEDGLADTFDGLWGGTTPERRLKIMKDSHIGTYGVLALGLSQLLRIGSISDLLTLNLLHGVVAAAIFSRSLMPFIMKWLPNARGTGLSHQVGKPQIVPVSVGLGLAFSLILILLGTNALIPAMVACFTAAIVAVISRSKICGQTGDILGSVQQVSEISFLLALTALI
ncbi:MAG: adenosylcobinamide-GDP ribazoletransferase [Ruegeria sp.]